MIKSTDSLDEFRKLERTIQSGNVEKDMFTIDQKKEDENIYAQDEDDK
jgi:hypothetical protein